MKVVLALLVASLFAAAQADLPHGSAYIGGFLCDHPPPPQEDSDAAAECTTTCGEATGGCDGETMLCCPTSPDCRACREGIPTDGARCMTEDEEEVSPLTVTLDEEECEFCVCVSGDFYCHELEEEAGCTNLTQPTEGASCRYGDRPVPPRELTVVQSEDGDCEICICGNGVLFCRDCGSGSVCVYNGAEVAVGDTVPSEDGCNECTCAGDGTIACTERACVCEDGEELVYCFRRPCDGARCRAHPEATCYDDYCGGCNTRWVLGDEDVTERCSEEPSGPIEPSQIPTCPAVELDTCSEDCSADSPCPDSQLCCRGCGSSCRIPVNLPSYEVPLVCPPLIVALSEDSDTCDLECQSNEQCSGDKICCRSGCSSSCQDGMAPPEPCNLVRELLEGDRDRDGAADSEGEPPLGRFMPGCSVEGYFNPVQVWENNRWCVNVATGEPIGRAHSAGNGSRLVCPNCTHNGREFYAGQYFSDGCSNCFCSETGVANCTRRACLDPCTLRVSFGSCEDREMQYFFNTESRLCEQFVYSGCGGNANRFSSAYNCLHACKPESVCLLEWDEGEPCNDGDGDRAVRDVYFYYDAERGECNSTFGYRCEGNGNRFQSGIDCLRTCDPDNPGPTDADGNSCWEIQCDYPRCGEGVEPVYREDSCCPGCPTEDECDDDQFTCRDGSCIPARRECDGLSDCSDRSDERDDECDPSILHCDFRCSEDECIPEIFVCDGVLDCSNARDEHDCIEEYVPGAPFYPPPFECPEPSDQLGACDVSECFADTECEGGKMCCLNNCNQQSCAEPVAATTACRAIVQRLSANVSFIPQCNSSGHYRPLQCTGEGEEKMCWCVNVLSGVPYTATSNSDDLECQRCDYAGSSYVPGQSYTAEDGCNTCLCVASGKSVCTRRACVEESCEVGRVTLDHGETKELDCLTCSCLYGQLNCSRIRDCFGIEISVQVEMTFVGELPTTEEELEELERDIERSLLQMYGESMDLDESQVEVVELRQGSVIVVVVLKDTEDQTGANITVLVYRLEEDYNDGVLVIRTDDGALVPSDKFKVEMITQEEEEDDDDDEFLWWHGLIIGVGGAVLVLGLLVVAIMLFAILRKRAASNSRVKADPNLYSAGTVEMKKVPLNEA